MCMRRCLVGLTFCTCYLAFYLTNKYVLSVLKFTYPTLFQGWQTLLGGLLLHVSWKLGWAEINSSFRKLLLQRSVVPSSSWLLQDAFPSMTPSLIQMDISGL
ncbi:transmembrane protein 241 [Rhinolophus ferrumequinum]|uniref:Transmembrane protein 241 n=1 Tax=Rhinolophus ferrumequinum TaxID=59479 RepID=A0A7J7TRG9_RHIFE|nr:transmembrane protein 241 [Rhinolophus ferrumequinum]